MRITEQSMDETVEFDHTCVRRRAERAGMAGILQCFTGNGRNSAVVQKDRRGQNQ